MENILSLCEFQPERPHNHPRLDLDPLEEDTSSSNTYLSPLDLTTTLQMLW